MGFRYHLRICSADNGAYVKIISILLRYFEFNARRSLLSISAFTTVIYLPNGIFPMLKSFYDPLQNWNIRQALL